MNRYLPDINTVLALLDPLHVHHDDAHRWYKDVSPVQLMICPHVENGVMRVASQPRYPNHLGTAASVREILKKFIQHLDVKRCTNEPSLMDDKILKSTEHLTPSSISDLYLLSVALSNDAKLATFDQRIKSSAIHGGKNALEIILPT